MIYLTAQKVASPGGPTGINAFRYSGAAVRSFELVAIDDVGTLEAQRVEVPPGGNEVLCYLDVLAPDATASDSIKRILEALRRGWSTGHVGQVAEDQVQASFVPGRIPVESTRPVLDELVAGLVGVLEAQPLPLPREIRPTTILISSTSEGRRYVLEEESAGRLRALNGPGWRPVAVTGEDEVAADFAQVAPAFVEMHRSLVGPLTGVDLARLHSEFGGVRFVERPSGKVVWAWPLPDTRPGYCLSCRQHGTLHEAGTGAFVCAYCGNLQRTDGLWVATLS